MTQYEKEVKAMIAAKGYPKLRPIRVTPKIERNAKCPCGSGLKYKKCCIFKKGA